MGTDAAVVHILDNAKYHRTPGDMSNSKHQRQRRRHEAKVHERTKKLGAAMP